MKKLVLPGVVASALSLLISPVSLASGWIVVDPITPRMGIPIGHPIHRPPGGLIPMPIPRPVPGPAPGPILKGNVSFGLHLQSEDVKVDINGPVARTYITQTFSNDSDQVLAGTYLFPLPDDTVFSSFTLEIDGKPVEGQILEAQEARQEYETIVRKLVDPGLLEYADYKTVRARVYPIPAHRTKKIQLEYTQAIKAENGLYRYKFPLKAEENAEPADAININMKLSSKSGLRTIWSPTHTIQSNRDGDHKATIKYEGRNVLPDKDFSLYYSVSDKDIAADFMAQRQPGEDGYFLLSVAPPVEAKAIERKDVVLIADTSGSMSGAKMEECKKALKYVVESLNPGDRFGLIQFNTDVEPFKYSLVDATPENKKAAVAFAEGLDARGGTNIGEALHVGTSMLANGDSTRPAYIVLMTDGEPTVGETDQTKLIAIPGGKRDVRVFDFGVGYDVNTRLLNRLAEGHHGAAQYVEPSENIETVLSDFSRKIKSPVLSDVKIAYEGVEVKDVYPREVKDVFAGSQVMLIGKYKDGASAKVRISGKVNGVEKQYVFPLNFPKEQSGQSYLTRLWAMRRIGYLTDIAQANGNTREVIDEIVALSKKYGIITQYTSFLAADPNEVNAHGMPVGAMGVGGGVRWNRRMAAAPPPPPTATMGAYSGGGGGIVRGSLVRVDRPIVAGADHVMMYGRPDSLTVTDSRPIMRDFRGVAEADAGAHARHQHYTPGALAGATNGTIGPAAAEPQMMDAFASKDLMGSMLSAKTGRNAVVAAKAIGGLRDSVSLDKEESAGKKSGMIKTVEDKTFYLVDGVWTDSDFDSKKSKAEEVEFGSNRYFDLVRSNPELRKYFAVANQLLVVFKGHCYKVVPPKTA